MLARGAPARLLVRHIAAPVAATGPWKSGASASPSTASETPLWCSMRFRSNHIRVANRKRVEMFIGKRFHLPTRLRVAAPDVAAEWDYEKNPGHLYPEVVGIGYMQPVWWKCAECEASYEMSVEKRVIRGGGCPACAARAVPATSEDAARSSISLLKGESNPALRPKRSATVLNLRTKY